MNVKTRHLLIGLCAIFLVACGGEEEQVDLIECGENTTVVDNQCVPDVPCADNEMDFGDGRCVRVDYCGEGTHLNTSSGTCVADPDAICDTGTRLEDGFCVPVLVITCAEGAVVAGGECVPHEDVCGPGTGDDGGDRCRPQGSICGEGTAFDVFERVCVPLSTLQCGVGTVAEDGICVPASAYYEALAANADLDLTAPEATGQITLKDIGETFVFVGNIDPPELVDGSYVQDQDSYSFEGEAGQWVRIGVYSLGLPEPGFFVEDETEAFGRLSDLGAGIEMIRDVYLPFDGEYSLDVFNMPQYLGNTTPAGGEDWGYVGFIEVFDGPEASEVSASSGVLNGNVRNLRQNLYTFSDVEEGDSVALVFSTRPLTADAEILVLDDELNLISIIDLDRNALAFDAPADEFYILFDRSYAYGGLTSFSATSMQGSSLAAGATTEIEVDLAAGEYVGLFQYNLENLPLSAAIKDGNTVLASTSGLNVFNANSGQLGLFWYAFEATTVTLEVENSTGSTVDFMNTDHSVGQGDSIGDIDGTLINYSYGQSIARGHRHYIELEVTNDELFAIHLTSSGAADLILYDDGGSLIAQGHNSLIHQFVSGDYLLAVEATSSMGSGFSMTIEETDIFEVSESSQPGWAIPSGGNTDTITIGSCPSIIEVTIDVDITHWWRGDVIVEVTAPNGTTVRLHNNSGGSADNIVGTYPFPSDPNLESGAGLLDLEGTNGTGDWVIYARDTWTSSSTGTFNSWGVNLVCEG